MQTLLNVAFNQSSLVPLNKKITAEGLNIFVFET